MKKLFLASVAYKTLDKVLPLLPAVPSQLKLAFIPTASELYDDVSWLDKDRDKLVEMGFAVKDVSLKDSGIEKLRIELANIDVVFVAGGNTFYLLEKVIESGFDVLIKEMIDRGVVYIGSSAGSVLVSPTIEFVAGFDDPSAAPSLKSFNGLKIVDFLVAPHYQDQEYEVPFTKMLHEWQNKEYELKLLTNNQALIVDDDKLRVVES